MLKNNKALLLVLMLICTLTQHSFAAFPLKPERPAIVSFNRLAEPGKIAVANYEAMKASVSSTSNKKPNYTSGGHISIPSIICMGLGGAMLITAIAIGMAYGPIKPNSGESIIAVALLCLGANGAILALIGLLTIGVHHSSSKVSLIASKKSEIGIAYNF